MRVCESVQTISVPRHRLLSAKVATLGSLMDDDWYEGASYVVQFNQHSAGTAPFPALRQLCSAVVKVVKVVKWSWSKFEIAFSARFQSPAAVKKVEKRPLSFWTLENGALQHHAATRFKEFPKGFYCHLISGVPPTGGSTCTQPNSAMRRFRLRSTAGIVTMLLLVAVIVMDGTAKASVNTMNASVLMNDYEEAKSGDRTEAFRTLAASRRSQPPDAKGQTVCRSMRRCSQGCSVPWER